MKPLVYTQHARTAAEQRQLQEPWIEQAVLAPDWVEADPANNGVRRHYLSIPERGNRYLRVAVLETPEHFRILTAFIDRGARPK